MKQSPSGELCFITNHFGRITECHCKDLPHLPGERGLFKRCPNYLRIILPESLVKEKFECYKNFSVKKIWLSCSIDHRVWRILSYRVASPSVMLQGPVSGQMPSLQWSVTGLWREWVFRDIYDTVILKIGVCICLALHSWSEKLWYVGHQKPRRQVKM